MLVTISAFGPYLLSGLGLRSDHVVILGVALLLLPRLLFNGFFYYCRSSALLAILAIQLVYTLWVSLVTLLAGYPKESSNLILADFQHCIQNIVIVWLVAQGAGHLRTIELRRTLRSVCLVTCLLLAANGVLALCQIFWDMSPFIEYFLRVVPSDSGTPKAAVSQVASAMGRYSGIINQPFESGVAYSIGLLCWIYCFAQAKRLKIWNLALLLLLLLGGFVSVSKVFIYGGIPVGLLAWNESQRGSLIANWKPIALFFILGLTAAVLLPDWTGWDHFSGQTSTDGLSSNPLSTITAGRYGHEQKTIEKQFAYWWEESPLYGFGFGYQGTLDSGYLEAVIKGGLVGMILQLMLIGVIGLWTRKCCWNGLREERILLRWIWILIIGTNIGMPVLIINRASILLWLVVCLCILIAERERFNKKVVSPFGIDGAGNQIPEQLRRRLAY